MFCANENLKSVNCIHARQNPKPWTSLSALYSLCMNVYEIPAEKKKKIGKRQSHSEKHNQEVHGNSGGAEETIAS